MIRAILIALIVISNDPRVSNAQDVIPDTLDWRRYFPLAVGSIWEYEEGEGPPLIHIEVVGDTVASGRHYYVRDTTIPVRSGPLVHRYFVRYDSSGGVVEVQNISADTLDVPDVDCDQPRSLHECVSFKTDFGDTLYAHSEWDHYAVTGGFGGSVLGVDVAATKCFYFPCCWTMCYAADVGWTEGGSLQYDWLTYARVDGREYGTLRYTSVDSPRNPAPRSLSAYPNPARNDIRITYEISKAEFVTLGLFDLLGRNVVAVERGYRYPGRYVATVSVSRMASGVYIVRLHSASRTETVNLVVLR